MQQKFARSLLLLSQKFLQLSALKYQIAQLVSHSESKEHHQPISNKSIDVVQFQNIISRKSNETLTIKHLSRILFKNQPQITAHSLCEYLGINHTSKTKNIINIIYLEVFADVVSLECQIHTLLDEIKHSFQKNADSIFHSMDINKMEMIDAFSIVNFVRTYSGCTISSKSAIDILHLIKGAKGEFVHQQEWTKCFAKEIGGIRSNKFKSIDKKINNYSSFENSKKLQFKTFTSYCQEPSALYTQNLSNNFTANFTKEYFETKRNFSRRSRYEIQNLITYKPEPKRSRDSRKQQLDLSVLKSQNQSHQHFSQIKQGLENTGIRGQESKRTKKTLQKQPYQLYLQNKKTAKNRVQIVKHLSRLNELLSQKQDCIARICAYPQFNLFNAFNILDCYDLGGINYGEFCRQLDNLDININEDNKRNFWSQVGRNDRHGLTFQNFIQLFHIKNSKNHFTQLKNRHPLIRRFEGICSWKKQLQYSYKQFLSQIINNIGESTKIKQELRTFMKNGRQILGLLTSSNLLSQGQFNQILGRNSDFLFWQITDEQKLSGGRFQQYLLG